MKNIRIKLIHWDAKQIEIKASELAASGFGVDADIIKSQAYMKALKMNPPDVFVIDLSRQPSRGLEMALYIRLSKPTRNIPIVFVEGEPEKVEKVRLRLPDAFYTGWGSAAETIREAVKNPPAKPAVPKSVFDGYSGTPLAKKLGIKEGMMVSAVNAPSALLDEFEELPDGVALNNGLDGDSSLILWFVRSQKELSDGILKTASAVGSGGVWIFWPKKTGSLESDLSQVSVRKTGLDTGLVDHKVCSFNKDWSGLKFASRKKS